jgi:4'-phosphopantetheinyl transferase
MGGQTSTTAPPAPAGWVVPARGSLRTALAPGTADVWMADLGGVPDGLCGLLCPGEIARAERFPRPVDGVVWARAHGLLRLLLGAYIDGDPRALRFNAGPHGKPALEREDGALEGPAFNLSHSGHLALLAFTAEGDAGVDVEVARRRGDVLGAASRLLGERQAEWLAGLEPHVREREFLRTWVRHEAAVKHDGGGLARGRSRTAAGAPEPPWMGELDVGPGAAAAVALSAPPRELRLLLWSGQRAR